MKFLNVQIKNHIFKVKVDNEDYKYLAIHKWSVDFVNEGFRVYTRINKEKVFLSRLFTKCPKGLVVDHINGDGLDNTRKNLRVCSVKENNFNVGKPKNKYCTSKYIGVSYDSRYVKPWKATISVLNKTLLIGTFKTEKLAAIARDKIAKQYRGSFARLNFKGAI